MRRFVVFGLLLSVAGCADLTGAPPVAPTPATPVFFQPFSAALDKPALDTIAEAAKVAANEPGARVTVVGAADPIGSLKANAYLSKTRAQVVADQLEADGVDPARIRVRAIGETNTPTGATQSGRRALIEIGG
jgi:outer membrane protein OmpA-like peptidoglycan-associated protein